MSKYEFTEDLRLVNTIFICKGCKRQSSGEAWRLTLKDSINNKRNVWWLFCSDECKNTWKTKMHDHLEGDLDFLYKFMYIAMDVTPA